MGYQPKHLGNYIVFDWFPAEAYELVSTETSCAVDASYQGNAISLVFLCPLQCYTNYTCIREQDKDGRRVFN